MVEILCPHCEGEIELDDDASGTYICPHCDSEFEWGFDDFHIPKSKSEKPWFIIAGILQIFYKIQGLMFWIAAIPVILFLVVIVFVCIFSD